MNVNSNIKMKTPSSDSRTEISLRELTVRKLVILLARFTMMNKIFRWVSQQLRVTR